MTEQVTPPRAIVLALAATVAIAITLSTVPRTLVAQSVPVGVAPARPSVKLSPAPPITFPSPSDSNSPAIWSLVNGRRRLFLMTSVAGAATRHAGSNPVNLTTLGRASFTNPPGHGTWFEAVIPDADGTWYGFYHNEWPDTACPGDPRTIPRIGAARSEDFGATWHDLGSVLEAPPGTHDCNSANVYFVGGVGDFSVLLDHDHRYLYIYFSQYANRASIQGVSVARTPWADRDKPQGRAAVWLRNQTWIPAVDVQPGAGVRWVYSAGAPIYRARDEWHGDETVDAYWGPSVHFNTHLQQYVMLLNRASDSAWSQEGVYVSFTSTPDVPASWSMPLRLLTGGRWYPQVLGTEVPTGTDRQAGEYARFFMGGRSDHIIQFLRPGAR